QRFEHAGEFIDLHRLRQVAVQTGPFDAHLVPHHGCGAQRNDRNISRLWPLAQTLRRLEPTHTRQVDVHDDGVWTAGAHELDTDRAPRRSGAIGVHHPSGHARSARDDARTGVPYYLAATAARSPRWR